MKFRLFWLFRLCDGIIATLENVRFAPRSTSKLKNTLNSQFVVWQQRFAGLFLSLDAL